MSSNTNKSSQQTKHSPGTENQEYDDPCNASYETLESCLAEKNRDWRECQDKLKEWKECFEHSKKSQQ